MASRSSIFCLPLTSARHLLLICLCLRFSRSLSQEWTNPEADDTNPSTGGGPQGTVTTDCSYGLAGVTLSFSYCVQLSSDGKFKLAWNADSGSGVATVYFQGVPDTPDGWAGWGISPNGGMPGSDVLVGYSSAVSPVANLYQLQGYAAPYPNPSNVTTSPLLSYDPGSLQVQVASSQAAAVVQILANVTGLAAGGPTYVIWKGGPGQDQASGRLVKHYSNAPANMIVDFSGASAGGGAEMEEDSSLVLSHAWLVALGYGFLLPIGVLIARHSKDFLGEKWYNIHIAVQLTGFALGLCGWAIGIYMSLDHGNMSEAPPDHQRHYNMGIAVFCFATVQLMTPFLKPNKDAPKRFYWNLVHWTLGYLTILLATINIFYGFDLIEEMLGISKGWVAVYIIFLVLWLAVFVVLEVLAWIKYKKQEPHMAYERHAGNDGL